MIKKNKAYFMYDAVKKKFTVTTAESDIFLYVKPERILRLADRLGSIIPSKILEFINITNGVYDLYSMDSIYYIVPIEHVNSRN